MSEKPDETIDILVIEDEQIMQQTIVDAFEQEDVRLRLGPDQWARFKCFAVSNLSMLAELDMLERKKFKLAIVDLSMGNDIYSGLWAMRQIKSDEPSIRIAVFTGISRASNQDWIDLILKLKPARIWEFFIKGRPTELVGRVIARWQKELDDESRRQAAVTKSQKMRTDPKYYTEWKGKHVAFYVDSQGRLRPDPENIPNDVFLAEKSYLRLLLKLSELRGQNPLDVPDHPFIALITGENLKL